MNPSISPKKSYKLKSWDRVMIDEFKRRLEAPILEEASRIDIPITFECNDYIIIDKPKWVLSHPNSIRNLKTPSVSAFLYQKYKGLPTIWNFIRSGIVHRLDKDTDGFMIVAKSEKSMEYFKNLFNIKTIQGIKNMSQSEKLCKEYVAICESKKIWIKNIQNITKNLPYTINMIVKAKIPGYMPKIWITKIKSIQKFDKSNNLYKIYLEIVTGRTHQIRYHLSKLGLPIIWDCIYNDNYKKNKSDWNQVLLQLSSYKLTFIDLYGEKKVFEKSVNL